MISADPIRLSSVLARKLGAKPQLQVANPLSLPNVVMVEGWPHLIILDERRTPWAWPVEKKQP